MEPIVDIGTAPLKAVGILPKDQPQVMAPPPADVGLSDAELSNIADEEAKRKAKKKSSGTQTVLTSPLGAQGTAETAVKKLGG